MTAQTRAVAIRRRRFPWLRLCIGASCIGALIALFLIPGITPWVLQFEQWTGDWRTAYFSDRLSGQHPLVAIVTINDDTLKDYASSPIDRGLLARIVRAVDAAGARAIGLDVFFLKKTEPEKDQALLTALHDARAEVVLGAIDERGDLQPFQRDFQQAFLAQAGRHVGYLQLRHERDDVVRKMARPAEDSAFSDSFARQLAKAGGSEEADDGRPISWLLPPKDGGDTFLTIPAQDLFEDFSNQTSDALSSAAAQLKDRIVLIGGDFPFRDRHRTPLSARTHKTMAGTTIQAQMVAALLDPGRRVSELKSESARILLVSLAVTGFALGWTLWASRIVDFFASSFATGALMAVDAVTFIEWRLILPFTLAFVTWVLAVTAGRSIRSVADWIVGKKEAVA